MGNVLMPLENDSKLLYLIRELGLDLVVIFEEFIFAAGKWHYAWKSMLKTQWLLLALFSKSYKGILKLKHFKYCSNVFCRVAKERI